MRSHLKLACKVLLRRKLFTAISLFGISFTLLVLIVLAAMMDHAFAPQAPETRQSRMRGIYSAQLFGDNSVTFSNPGYEVLDRYVRNLPGAERTSIVIDAGLVQSYVATGRVDSKLKRTDAEFWRIMDFRFLEGGPYQDDDVAQARFVAVISAGTRQRLFDGAPALGRSFEADGQRFRVIGVVPDVSPWRDLPHADVWAPLTTAKSNGWREGLTGSARGIVLARDDGAIPGMKAALLQRLLRWQSPNPREWQRLVLRLESPFEAVAGQFSDRFAEGGDFESHPERLVLALAVLAGLFMLLPAVNLVNLNVSRILERASEIGVRKAFGASSRALVAQFVAENVLLTLLGAVLALGLSWPVLHALMSADLLGAVVLSLNLRVFLAGVGLALVFGLVSGVYPAWKMARLHPVAALKGAGR
jgi:putative ABC transport system permease protein